MSYVLDTSAYRVLRHYYPETFETLWQNLEGLITDGIVFSVREVWNELQDFNDNAFLVDWALSHRAMFLTPTEEEMLAVQSIFQVEHFQALISQRAILKGKPVADPFVIASARVREATVITQEGLKPNAAKIPNVCAHFNIPCQNLEWFMREQGWKF